MTFISSIEIISSELFFQDESAIEKLVQEILQKWASTHAEDSSTANGCEEVEDVDAKLAKLLESNIKTNSAQRVHTDEERQLRSRILEEFGQVQVPDEAEFDGDQTVAVQGEFSRFWSPRHISKTLLGTTETDPDLVKNTNVQDVQALRKERREQSKLESQMKKDKDKEDRERQKKQREEKKDKRKTVKQERRR